VFYYLLTVRLKPIEGESLFSYLIRLANGNGLEFLSFWNMIRRSRYAQMGEVHRLNFFPFNLVDIDALVSISKQNKNDLLNCTFSKVINIFCSDSKPEKSRFLQSVILDKLKYCPKCLAKNKFYKLIWSIEDVKICSEHNVYLLDKCTLCGNEIKGCDIKSIGICPHCGQDLSKNISIGNCTSDGEFMYMSWLNKIWETLLSVESSKISPDDVALKCLFILNKRKNGFSRELILKSLADTKSLAVLMQHARGSLSTKRSLHISFLLSVLYRNSVCLKEFLELEIPEEFRNVVLNKAKTIKENSACKASWCKNYNIPGLLMKTGTTYKERKNGEKRLYYMVCPECGCEYAYNEYGDLTERGYFIKGYDLINKYINQEISIRELAASSDYSVDKLRRCMAYYATRDVFESEKLQLLNDVNTDILNEFSAALDAGLNIKEIESWNCWKSYNHYLAHRYHYSIIKKINEDNDLGVITHRNVSIHNSVRKELQKMLRENKDITIQAVCEKLGVTHEVIRYWGCNQIIAKMKKRQKNIRIESRIKEIMKKFDIYMNLHLNDNVKSEDLYKYIGIGRTILHRISAEKTRDISRKLKMHNKLITKCNP
jgi:small nuclear ribonucleoprotein (snRNP)-like protein